MSRACSRHGELRNAKKTLVGKPEWNRPIGRPRCSRGDNIKMDLKEIVWKVMDWIHLAQDRDRWRFLVNTILYLLVLQIAEFLDQLSDC
jgi:hypothetical protein